MNIDKDFVLLGKVTLTIELPSGNHYTYAINGKEGDSQYPPAWFVSLLTGSNNERDYSYIGMLEPKTGNVRLTRASKFNEDTLPVKLLVRTLARIWSDELDVIRQHGYNVHHSGKCGICGKKLTTPESIERGIGPDCFKHHELKCIS